ncbi:MAG: hypothetical protein MST00_04335 [Tenericutes bacterium]|nr:hypothetical protein [Mycoplasmatota bacterium]
MIGLVTEINNKLKNIISELEAKKNECESTLANVKTKIDQKIEEAKRYKLDVDNAKAKIKTLEEEIKTLEIDLADLNERFGKKDLNAVVEAGNREINAKMIAKQNEITRYREKIGELTEKARAIKDLLINLKKDKEIKSARLENYIKATNYYSRELNRVIDFASENPDTLDDVSSNYEKTDYSSDINLDSPVFDEISKMEDSSDDLYEEKTKEGSYEPELQKMDFKALNDSIDSEYASIFGTPLEEDNKEEKAQESAPLDLEEENVFEKKDLSDEEIPDNSLTFEPIKEEELNAEPIKEELPKEDRISASSLIDSESDKKDNSELINLFTENGVDFYSFNEQDQKLLIENFNKEMYKKVFDVLKKNNISLNYIYDAANIFTVGTPSELEHVLTKLLLASQTTLNISYVLSALPLINSFDLSEVIKSYGPSVSNANIADLIIKAKHLNDMGGNR